MGYFGISEKNDSENNGLYSYCITEQGEVVDSQIVESTRPLSITSFAKKGFIVFQDLHTDSVLMMNPQTNEIKELIKVSNKGLEQSQYWNKSLKADRRDKNLFILEGLEKIFILCNLDKKGRFDLLELNPKKEASQKIYLKKSNISESSKGVYSATLGKLEERISEFEPIGDDMVLVLWSSGKLTLWKYKNSSCVVVCTFDLRNEVGFDESIIYNTFSTSADKSKIVVASCNKFNQSKEALHLLSLENTGYIEYRSTHSFKKPTISMSNTCIQTLNFTTAHEEYPILYCKELEGNKNVSIYSVEDDIIYELESKNHAFYSMSHSLSLINGELMSVDIQGYLYQLNKYMPYKSMKESLQLIKLNSIQAP